MGAIMDDIQLPEVPENLKPENAPVEEPAAVEEVVETQPEATEEPVVEQQVEATEEEKKGASARIRELNQKVKSLSERLAEVTQPTMPLQQPAYVPTVRPGEELTMEQYQSDVSKSADAKLELRLAQERAINRIDKESAQVIQKYPQLDPNSDQFDRELSDAVVEATEAQVRVNPYTASVTKVVDTLMKPYQRAATKEVSRATQQVARQAGEGALRPTSVRQPEKPAAEKSIQELERDLGLVQA